MFIQYENKRLGGYSSPFEIPLNPPLSKGDFTPPLEKGGRGGIFMPWGDRPRAWEFSM
jgi:hypothetical protein